MASRRPDGSFRPYRGRNPGRNHCPPIYPFRQNQRNQNAQPIGGFHGNERSPQEIQLPGTVYAMESHGIPCEQLPNTLSANIPFHPPLQLPPLFSPRYFTPQTYSQPPPIYSQAIPNNQPIHNLESHHYNQPIHGGSRNEVEAANSDRFGMRGLADVISGSNENVTSLAIGRNHQTFALYDNMYCTYNLPWSARIPYPPPLYSLPRCYLEHQVQRSTQQSMAMHGLRTLFYIFYSMPNDEAQLLAADELHKRGWFYHKVLRVWLKHSGGTQPEIKTDTYEKGSFLSFDPHTWDYVPKENFTLFYDQLEAIPILRSV